MAYKIEIYSFYRYLLVIIIGETFIECNCISRKFETVFGEDNR